MITRNYGFIVGFLLAALIINEVSANCVLRNIRHGAVVVPSTAFDVVSSHKRMRIRHRCVTIPRGGGDVDASQFIDQAYGWATNLGAPAALVAGAVIATLYESMASGSLDIEKTDKKWVKVSKKATRLLLIFAFIQQIVCIFCTTILGTHLLSHVPAKTSATTALGYLKENYEFEYLTSRISFIQGLVTWLGAIALEHAIPQSTHENEARRRMETLIASSLLTLVIAMLSFYNDHMGFYKNLFDMHCHYGKVVWLRYAWVWPPRVLSVIAIAPLVTSIVFFFKVFLDFGDEEAK